LAEEALGDGVEGEELEVAPELVRDALEGDEGARTVDILLVDLVSEEDEALLLAQGHDLLHVAARQDGAGRVAGVDHDEAPRRHARRPRLLEGAAQLREVEGPPTRLVKVVGDGGPAEEGNRG